MSDTDKSNGKEAMPDAKERKECTIWQVVPNAEGLDKETLEEMVLPPCCNTVEDLLQHLQKSETVVIFEFQAHLQMLAIAHWPSVRANMHFNFCALKITGNAISGPLFLACICDEQIVNMDEFFQLCKESGMQMREFKLGTEKQFPGLEGDMLHRLVRTTMKYEKSKKQEEREASPDSGSVAAASGSGAAASEVGVRRSGRVRKRKEIFDPSIVKRELQGD